MADEIRGWVSGTAGPVMDAAVKKFQSEPHPCEICGALEGGGVMGIYEPGPKGQKAVSAPPGKTRLFLYRLCARCLEKPKSAEIVEDHIHAQYRLDALPPGGGKTER